MLANIHRVPRSGITDSCLESQGEDFKHLPSSKTPALDALKLNDVKEIWPNL